MGINSFIWRISVIGVVIMAGCICDASRPSITNTVKVPWEVTEDEDVLMTCVLRNAGGHPVLWKLWKKDEPGRFQTLLTAGETRVTRDPRFSVVHNPGSVKQNSEDVWALSIKSVQLSDAGFYVCEIINEPKTMSLSKLNVLSKYAAPRNKTLKEKYWELSREQSFAAFNFTGCCEANNVSEPCFGFCNVQSILDGNTGQDPENCEQDFPAIRRCMMDGRDHVPCCIEEKVPNICQDICKGEYTSITDYVKSHTSCSTYMEQTISCIAGGIELLPSPPQDLEVEPLTEKSLKVSWSLSRRNHASVTEYIINVTYLTSFDNPTSTSESYIISSDPDVTETRSWQVKVPANKESTILNDLTPFTMYEITAIAVNIHGTSLPSNAVRSLTLTPGILKRLKVAEPPRVPDTKQCCIEKGITNAKCINIFCDASNSGRAKENDLLHCASKAPDAFSCLANGHDHSPCCKSRGLPEGCLDLCRGNVSTLHYDHYKCLEFMTDYVNCLLQGYGVLPGPPSKVHVTNVAPYYAILHWSPPNILGDTVQYYNLYFRKLNSEEFRYSIIRKVHPPYILENLESNTEYEIYLNPVNAHGIGQPSARLIFKTQSKLFEEEVKKSLTYNVTSCCIAVSLSEVCMPLCTYDAKMSDLKSLASMCTQDFHKVLKCGAGGRDHGKCCERRGVPNACLPLCNGEMLDSLPNITKNCSPYIGNIVQCFEEGTDLLPGPVEEFYGFCRNDLMAMVKWNAPRNSHNITHYVVHYDEYHNENASDLLKPFKYEKKTINIFEEVFVSEEQTYKIYVTAHNNWGSSLPSSVLIIKCYKQITSPPQSLAVSGHSATWITFSWQPPSYSHPMDNITYKFQFKPSDEEIFSSVTTSVTSHTLDKLTPNKQYIIYVTAHIPQGESLPSETLVAWTDPAYPAFVEPPTVHPVNLIMEGSSMTVLCIAMGTPMPTISLYISGRLIRQEITRHMVTKIHNVTRDMDQISCYADNGYGTPMQASRKITISHVPIIQASGTTMAVLGGSAVFECNVTAVPQPQMAFWRDPLGRIPVIQGPKYDINILPDNEEKSKYVMRLVIQEITELDEGDYFCHAENAFGSVVKQVAVRIHNTASTHNVTQCCIEQNVTSGCMEACNFYLDIDSVIEKPECIADFDKLMKCAADGSDHRSCCAAWGVPRRCLDWCRGEPLLSAKLCVLSHTKQIAGCFHEGRDKLPGPPQNVRVVALDDRSVRIRWDRPMKNPHTVEIYRVFWRPIGVRTPEKMDTKEMNLHITALKEGVTYECVIKAGNHFGTSALTEPIQFTVGDKYVVAEASINNNFPHKGLFIGIVLISVIVASLLIGLVWLVRNRKIFGIKSLSGVAFENPSYLKEINTDVVQNGMVAQNGGVTETTNSVIKSLPSVSGGTVLRQELLQVQQEVNPSLYEELKLGQDGVGFKRLKLVSKGSSEDSFTRMAQDKLFDETPRKDAY